MSSRVVTRSSETHVVVTDAEVTLADVLSLRIAVGAPFTDGTRLVLRQRGTGVERQVRLGASRTKAAAVAVSLAPLSLTPGRWDAFIEHDARVRLRSIDPGFSLDRLDAYALGRRTMAYRAYRTRNGFLAIKIDETGPLADVRAVWLREGRFEVTGILAYTGLDDDDQDRSARLALRHDDAQVSVAATVQGVRFHAALSLCDVLAATPDSQGVWEPTLEVAGIELPLPLGARLDDIEGKRRRVHYPATKVDGVPIRPSYTADDELRLEVGG
ncbi:hypothetical protein J5X84_43345 [Streptosporangiaceae bacterium NEAU-GS5]|nr:hypothetical protein [Streptosporangiaceae bacterium NEAU-GS5]